jgi:ADP-ribose diphosphatase
VHRHGPFSCASLGPADVEIVEREVAWQGFFRIERFRVRHRLFSGGWSEVLRREVFERGTAAGILLYDPERDAVVLVEQFRLPAHLAGFSPWQLEIVAGIIDRERDAEAVVRAEAVEEAGVAVEGDIVPIHRFMTSQGGSTEIVTLFCGRVDSRGAAGVHGLVDEGEDIRVRVLAWREAAGLVRRDAIENAFTLVALYWLKQHRPALRRMWLGADRRGRVAPEFRQSGGKEET